MYTLEYTGQFKKDLKKVSKQGLSLELLQEVLYQLEANGQVEEVYKPQYVAWKLAGLLGVSHNP